MSDTQKRGSSMTQDQVVYDNNRSQVSTQKGRREGKRSKGKDKERSTGRVKSENQE